MAQNAQLQIRAVGSHAEAVTGARRDYDPLMNLIGDNRFVLLGEASHGTHDFYHTRAKVTQWLIEEKGFSAIAVEADWPDALLQICLDYFIVPGYPIHSCAASREYPPDPSLAGPGHP
jgi:hypothetical protein